jgi:hypothetical protein
MEQGDLEAAKAHNPVAVEEVTGARNSSTEKPADEPATEQVAAAEEPTNSA